MPAGQIAFIDVFMSEGFGIYADIGPTESLTTLDSIKNWGTGQADSLFTFTDGRGNGTYTMSACPH